MIEFLKLLVVKQQLLCDEYKELTASSEKEINLAKRELIIELMTEVMEARKTRS